MHGPVAASSQRVVDCVIVVADLGGSEGAVEQAERTVGDGGGNVTPTAVPDHEADEEKDKGVGGWQRGRQDLTRSEMVECGRVL